MNEMIERQLVAMELPFINDYFWVKYLDGDFCPEKCGRWRSELESAIIIELQMKLRWN